MALGLRNEQGFALITALLIMVVLTIIGFSAMNTAEFDLDIVRNERIFYRWFLTADSGWKEAAAYLNSKSIPPDSVNSLRGSDTTREGSEYYDIVRNFGDGDDGEANTDFTDSATRDGVLNGEDYRYKVVELEDPGGNVPVGSSPDGTEVRPYKVISHAGTVDVEVILRKTFTNN